MTPIADTGLLVGFLDTSDQYHAWAARSLESVRTALVTCEAVIAETEYLVPGSGPLLMSMVTRGALQIDSILPSDAEAIHTLMSRYERMPFADACIVRLSERHDDAVVYTTDKRDFSTYRRHRNKPIPILTP